MTASNILGWQLDMNNAGEVVFNATLYTDGNAKDLPDTDLFVWSHGVLHLVARTGNVTPGVSTIAHLRMNVFTFPPPPVFVPDSGAHNNDRGQVVFGARLVENDEHGEQGGVLLVATPNP